MKYLIWAVVIYLAWRWYTVSRQSPSGSVPSTDSTRAAPNSGADEVAESMVKCAQCGIHLPGSEAIHGPSAITFCSEEHRRLHGER
ncbi:MAG: hypothetical protein FJY60_09225 [Betaproteobacteria bacterium]|nr:hypothetical protein [Betaproteobacteria bacterium]